MTACGRRRSGSRETFMSPVIPLRTSTVREPPSSPSPDVHAHVVAGDEHVVGRHPDAVAELVHRRPRRPADHDGRGLEAFAIAAVIIAPRLKIGPFAPAYASR
jgi:hypothetical protein